MYRDLLVVESDISALRTMEALLRRSGYGVRCAPSGQLALTLAQGDPPALILLDLSLPDMDALEVYRKFMEDPKTSAIPVVFLGEPDAIRDKLRALEAGKLDYLTKPFGAEEVLARLRTRLHEAEIKEGLLANNKELRTAHDEIKKKLIDTTGELVETREKLVVSEAAIRKYIEEIESLRQSLEAEKFRPVETARIRHLQEGIVGQSASMKGILARLQEVAPTDSTVLVLGETGTGKELLARAIHRLSTRAHREMVTVNCAALPPALIESELFGREKGAYTGALTRMVGRFEAAHGSTLFLDEIGELPLDLQSKLLRVLEEGRFQRLGSAETIKADVRIIVATNRDLAQEVMDGRFRRDLYYRINVFPILIPPLRERPEDIPSLAWQFVRELEKRIGKRIEAIPERVMEALQRYSWPGNARELRNVIERAMIVSKGKILDVNLRELESGESLGSSKLEDVERQHILKVLESVGWRVAGKGGAAQVLGLKRSTLESRMRKLGIRRPPGRLSK